MPLGPDQLICLRYLGCHREMGRRSPESPTRPYRGGGLVAAPKNFTIQVSTTGRFVTVALWQHEACAMCIFTFELFVDRTTTELCVWTVKLSEWIARIRRCKVRKTVFIFFSFKSHCAIVWHSFDVFTEQINISMREHVVCPLIASSEVHCRVQIEFRLRLRIIFHWINDLRF